ncbi:hypothetical protein D3C84_615920 [compost metagenome]
MRLWADCKGNGCIVSKTWVAPSGRALNSLSVNTTPGMAVRVSSRVPAANAWPSAWAVTLRLTKTRLLQPSWMG